MSESVASVRDSLNAAFDAAERPAPPPPRPEPQQKSDIPRETRPNGADIRETVARLSPESTEPSTESHESEAEPERRGGDRPRDQFGRFMASTPEAPSERPPDEPAPEPLEPPTDQPETGATEQAPGPAILAPRSWSAAARDHWHALPRPIQEEVARREREVSVAFQQRAEQVNVLEPLAQAIQPYSQKLALRGVNPASAVQQLLAVQDLLEHDPVAGVAHVAKVYGVDLRSYATAYQQAQQPQDPRLNELQQEVAQQRQMISSWQQAAQAQEQARINDEVARFAADTRTNPYFEHVRERMAELMATGGATTLAQAYRLACADNEQVSAHMAQTARAAETAQRSAHERQAVDRARRAAVSVSGSPYGGAARSAPKKNQSVRDAVMDAMETVADR